MFSLFKRKPDPEEIADDLSALFAHISVHELQQLSKLWGQPLDDEAQVVFFLEYSFFLTAVADRLAHQKFGDPLRGQILNLTLNRTRGLFCRQSHFGQDISERIEFFESYFRDTFRLYAGCDSIMGDSQNQVVLVASQNLVQAFLRDRTDAEKVDLLFQTAKSLTTSLVALLQTPSFKRLC
ncbi:MAG: hypothetical protein WCS31_13305 [Verrucomicrobiae bacterium]